MGGRGHQPWRREAEPAKKERDKQGEAELEQLFRRHAPHRVHARLHSADESVLDFDYQGWSSQVMRSLVRGSL